MNMKKKGVKATFFRRVVAYFLDVLIIFVVIGMPLAVNLSEDQFDFMDKPFDYGDLISTTLVGILTIFYWSIFDYKLKQTPGKMIAKIYVNPTNKNLTFAHAVIRNLSKLSGLILIFDCAYMFFKKTNQRYLETIAETEVLRYE